MKRLDRKMVMTERREWRALTISWRRPSKRRRAKWLKRLKEEWKMTSKYKAITGHYWRFEELLNGVDL